MDIDRLASVARALSHPARVRILQLLARQSDCSGAEVFSELPLAQSTVSEHLRILREAGLVSAHPQGTTVIYCLDPEPVEELIEQLGYLAEAPVCESNSGFVREDTTRGPHRT